MESLVLVFQNEMLTRCVQCESVVFQLFESWLWDIETQVLQLNFQFHLTLNLSMIACDTVAGL